MPALLCALALLLAFALPAGAGPPAEACADGSCFPGGGKAATDCFAELEGVHPNAPFSAPAAPKQKPKKEVRCYDGDAGCDLDGEPNGTCRFPVDTCLFNTDPNLAACTPAQVTAVSVKAKASTDSGAALQTALNALLPAAAPVCTDGATLDVPLKVKGSGELKQRRVKLGLKATSDGGKDSDTLSLTCMPRQWPAHGADHFNRRAAARTTIAPANVASLVEKWTFDAQGSVTSTPTVDEKNVYVTSWSGLVFALDRKKGKVKWSYDTGTGPALPFQVTGVQSSATLSPDGRLLVGDGDNVVHCLDTKNGNVLWTRDLELLPQDRIWGSPTVANNRVLVPIASDGDTPCTKGRLVALDLDSGEPLWTVRTAPDRVCEEESTQGCTVDGDCDSGRCVGECAGDRGIACQIDEDCGADEPCEDAIGGGVTATPATDVTGDTVFMVSVGCYTGPRIGNSDRFFRIDATDGTLEWALPDFPSEPFGPGPFNDYGFLNGPIVSSGPTPALIGASKDGKLYGLDPATGSEVFTEVVGDVTMAVDAFAAFGLFNGAPGLAGGRVFAGLNMFNDGTPDLVNTQAFDAVTGMNAWDASLDMGPTWGSVGIAGDVVFVGKSNIGGAISDLHAFDAEDGTHLHTFTLPEPVSSGPSIVDGELFVGFGVLSGAGGVRAYELP